MKLSLLRYIFTVLCLSLVTSIHAQNLVLNGSFEQYVACPTAQAQMNFHCYGWRTYTAATPDYHRVCGSSPVSVPSNFAGNQAAAQGQAYVGLLNYYIPVHQEYVVDTMTALMAGGTYEVSMSVSLADSSTYASSGLGVWFYKDGPIFMNQYAVLTVTPHVSFDSYGLITSKTSWTRVSGVFTADSAYSNIVLGGFTNHSSQTRVSTGQGFTDFSYYYIDSVYVRSVNGVFIGTVDTLLCEGDIFQVPYTINSTAAFNTGNTFTAQLSNSSGSFTSGVTNIGSITSTTASTIACNIPSTVVPGVNYRIRIKSSNIVDSSAPTAYYVKVGSVRPIKPVASTNGPVCAGQALNLSANSTTTGVSYSWAGPNNYTSNLQNPVISPVSLLYTGTYIVTAGLLGCTSKDTAIVTVLDTNSNIAGSNSPICERDTLKLNTTITGTYILSYQWAGPNSFHSASRDTVILNSLPTHSGNYVLTLNLGSCSIKDTIPVLIKPLAANRTIGSNSPVCAGRTLNLTSGSTSGSVGYTWTGPLSYVTTTQNPTITNMAAANAGNYVIAYSLNGCTVKDSVAVTVNQSPVAVIASSNAPVCELDTLKLFSTNNMSGVTWSWTGPSSFSSSVQNPYIANSNTTASGDYVITVALSNGCNQKDTVTTLVKPIPANHSNSNNGPICAGATLNLTGNTTSSGVTWSWTGPGSFTSSSQNPAISSTTTATSGDYIATSTLNGCSVKDTTIVLIKPIPAVPIPSANTPVCIGQDLKLNATTISGVSYEWTGPLSYSSTIQNPVRNSANSSMAGIYYIRAVLNGCYSANNSVTVNVAPAPNISLYPSPKDSICQGTTLTLVSTSTNAGTSPVYKWYKNNAMIAGAANVNYNTASANDMDAFFCSMTSSGVCFDAYTDSSNTITIRVFPWLAPSVSITQTPTGTIAIGKLITFNATPVNGGNTPQYQWKQNSANVIGATSNTWGATTLSNKDKICVEMSSSYLCPNPAKVVSNCIEVSILNNGSGINGLDWKNNPPNVYPNPTKDQLIIEGIAKSTTIIMTDIFGRTVINEVVNQATEYINTTPLIPGNYMLQLKYEENTITLKITKD
jgi:hypothetical protein